jgi:hypothetical protein
MPKPLQVRHQQVCWAAWNHAFPVLPTCQPPRCQHGLLSGRLRPLQAPIFCLALCQNTGLPAALTQQLEPLNDEQHAIFADITGRGHGIFVVSGRAGTGKSHLIAHLRRWAAEANLPAILCASTNAAAVRLGREFRTVHDAFAINSEPHKPFPALRATNPAFHTLKNARVFIIDEAFMLTTQTFLRVVLRLHQTGNRGTGIDAVFGDRLMVLVGDHQQLPPVCHCWRPRKPDDGDAPQETCRKCHLTSNAWVDAAKKDGRVHRLRTSMRHKSDPEFSAFLEAAADAWPSAEEIQRVLGDCVVTKEAAEELMGRTAAILCTHCEDVAAANAAALAQRWPADAIIQVPAVYSTGRIQESQESLESQESQEWCESPAFHRLTAFAVGAPAVLTNNIDKVIEATNAAACIITKCNFRGQGDARRLTSIAVRIDSSGEEVVVTRSFVNKKPFRGHTAARHTFPLELAYAMTAHRCQGATLSALTLVAPRRAFAQGQLNVLLSRVTDRKFLRLTRLPNPEEFDTFRL